MFWQFKMDFEMHSKQISRKHSHEHAQLHKILPSATLPGADLPEEPHWDNEGTLVLPLEVYSQVHWDASDKMDNIV